ncbi:MAG: phosphoglycerate kinase [Parcubacteria bacterium C7867-007]|nr:MAG: phosphoglycerate kinase [Parcubacteria bacterium C7867-007]
MRSVRDIPELTNIPVLVRASLNVPIADGKVANTFRLRSALPTIEYLRSRHARVILIGHLGEKGTETLAPVCEAMKAFIPRITFCPSSTGPEARAAVRAMNAGDVLMLENLRRNAGETKNDSKFATALAELADVFVEDAFDVCHREHASVVGVPELLPSYAGLLVEEEVKHLTKALSPASPSVAIIGGAKFSTKEPVLVRLLERYDRVFVGGALANDFMRVSGKTVGTSLLSSDADDREIRMLMTNPRLMLPIDEVTAPLGSTRSSGEAEDINEVPEDEAILDDGPKTVAALAKLTANAKTILWNGPLGNYEKGFVDATEGLAKAVAQSNAYSILGGGDTVAAVEKLGLSDRFSFISTGGGAMLDFLAKDTLPGIEALG